MTVDERTSLHGEQAGVTYYFCCETCRRKFLGLVTPQAATGPVNAYICPMCPEVRSDRPGACPRCGMALEPEQVGAEPPTDDTELRDMTWRLAIAAAGSAPVFLIAMGPMAGVTMPSWLSGSAGAWWQLLLSSPVVLGAGWPIFARAARSLATRHLNMFTLIGLGTGAAYLYSVAVTIFPDAVPPALRTMGLGHAASSGHSTGMAEVYFESAAVITTLVLLGQVIELRARRRTGDAIRALLDLAPPVAHVLRGGQEIDLPLDQVMTGETLRVRSGEKVPVDGELLDGASSVSEAMLTGESMPVTKSPGDAVIAGTLNQSGSFTMRADRVGSQTLLAQIIQLVGRAQRSRAPIQRVADQVAGWFVPAVVAASFITFCAWFVWGGPDAFALALVHAVSVLIIACPCALGLATPMSIIVGVGRGAREGVLIRDAEVLERLECVDTVVLDKTGTLTTGHPELKDVLACAPFLTEDVLRFAASVERSSEHPLARAVVAAAQARGIELLDMTDFNSVVGQGVRASVAGRRVRVGTKAFCEAPATEGTAASGLVTISFGPPAPLPEPSPTWRAVPWEAQVNDWRSRGHTVLFVGVDGEPAGMVAVNDPLKPTTPAALAALRALGLRLVMLTGDNERTAREVARDLPLDEIHAGLHPQDKLAHLRRLKQEQRTTAMLGDGVNDAPALAAADVGVAMGTGSDVAIESAGVTLVQGDLRAFVRARALSRQVMRNIRQNLFFAFIYNALGIPLAAGVLAPWLGISLSPMFAAAAMSLSSVSVIANALRLANSKLGD